MRQRAMYSLINTMSPQCNSCSGTGSFLVVEVPGNPLITLAIGPKPSHVEAHLNRR